MLRYLKAAFLVQVPVPINAVATALLLLLVHSHPFFASGGLAADAVLVIVLSLSKPFQALAAADALPPSLQKAIEKRKAMLSGLPGAARNRYNSLEITAARVIKIGGQFGYSSAILANVEASLDKLLSIYARVLVARTHLETGLGAEAPEKLQFRIATLHAEVSSNVENKEPLSKLQGSRRATAALLERRLTNLYDRDRLLNEHESDLQRIEAHVQLMLEDASLGGMPKEVDIEIGFASDLASADPLAPFSASAHK